MPHATIAGPDRDDAAGLPSPQRLSRRPVNLRSVALGLGGVIFICGLTPYNNYVIANTPLVGSYLPIGLLLFFGLFLALINAPLARWAPRQALQPPELAVAMGMTLVSCAVPGIGLMAFLPAHLIGIHIHAGQDADMAKLLNDLNLPKWIFPTIEADDFRQRALDPVVRSFIGRAVVPDDSFLTRFNAVPWSEWLTPAFTWGVLLACVWSAILFLCVILRRQWIENERLAFPLATVYLSLIEPSGAGKAPGTGLMKSRPFWIAFSAVCFVHLLSGLHEYSPAVPAVPLAANIGPIFADTILRHSEMLTSPLRVQFIIIGVMYFVQTRVAFSLWAFFLLGQSMMVMYGMQGSSLTNAMRMDEQFGALIVYGLFIGWIGRHHWMLVIRQMIRGRREDEPCEKFLPFMLAGWGLVLSLAGIVVWLVTAGTTVAGAIVIVLMLMLLLVVMARIIAETGLIIGEIPVAIGRTWVFLAHEVPSVLTVQTTLKTHFFTSMFTGLFTWDMREPLPVYATHATKVADSAAYPGERPAGRAFPFIAVLALSLLIGYAVAGASMLYSEYSYAATLDTRQSSPLNSHSLLSASREWILDRTAAFAPPRDGEEIVPYNRGGHFVFGAILTAVTGVLRLRFVNWPLHPAGFLVANTGPMRLGWFSIFLGWMLKSIIVRFGGSRLYAAARPVFIGLILGEVAIAALWLVVSLILIALDVPYKVIQLM